MMKNICIALTVSFLLFSCKSKNSSSVIDSLKSNPSGEVSGLVGEFKPILQGEWVKSDYINSIDSTRSPYRSRKHLKGVVDISIDMRQATKDSVIAGISLNNHEGSQFTILFKQGRTPTSLKTTLPDYDVTTNFYELGYYIKNADTSLVLYHISKNKAIIDSVSYTRVLPSPPSGDNAGSGIDYYVNKKLFTGTYTTLSADDHKSYVEFDNEGNVYNFFNYKTYYANADFVAGPANNIDQLDFDVNTKKQKEYTYQLIGDTLTLYEINYDADSLVQSRGKFRYKLVKQNKK